MRDDSWPVEDLVEVPICPACGSAGGATVLYPSLTDRVFGISPGKWRMVRCSDCCCAWLNPRPSDDSLGRAYEGYFTHGPGRDSAVVRRKAVIRAFLHDAIRDYTNHRYGTSHEDAVPLGRWLVRMIPPLRHAADAVYRNMPRNTGGRLLDVGCGNGDFLRLARSVGWSVFGVDFDPEAVETAKANGLEVRLGGVESLADLAGTFDVVTSSHVLEHVPNPLEHLAALYSLLKPGGFLWIETPNLGSLGHAIYKDDWRGLEPPRHLWIPSRKHLMSMVKSSGFTGIQEGWSSNASFSMIRSSRAIRGGRGDGGAAMSMWSLPFDIILFAIGWLMPSLREFATISARRPN